MTRIVKSVLLVASVFSFSLCGAQERYTTYGKANGYYWVEVLGGRKDGGDFAKTAYLLGFEDGLRESLDESASAKKVYQVLDGVALEEKIAALDRVFQESSNRNLPIRAALALECSRIKGEVSREEYDTVLRAFRMRYGH